MLAPALLLSGVVIGVLSSTSLRQHLFGRPATPHIESLAVLPVVDLSGNPDQDFFADGMTEALITDLGKISALRVISRTSVVQYKGTKKPLPEIARELNVDVLVEGTVLRSGNHLRITANLLQASPREALVGRKLRERRRRCTHVARSSGAGHRARDSGDADAKGTKAAGQRPVGGSASP